MPRSRLPAVRLAAAVLGTLLACVQLATAQCPGGSTQYGPYYAYFSGGWCSLCGTGYNCGSYAPGYFGSPIDSSQILTGVFAWAYGALNCDGYAVASSYLNGRLVGSHPVTGDCWCYSCEQSSRMQTIDQNWNYNYGVGASNTISYSMSGTYMCTAYVQMYICSTTRCCGYGTYGTSSCTNCPTGTYRDQNCGTILAHCFTCPAGVYGGSTGLQSSGCSGSCSAGCYCPAGSTSSCQAACPAGRYGTGGSGTSSCTNACSIGCYCVAGSSSSCPALCPAGRYGGSTGLPDSTCSGACPAGYYCPAGATGGTACGGDSVYCPGGTGGSLLVPPGNIPTGTVGARSGYTACPAGSYCVSGVQYSCPLGTYGNSVGLSSSSCSGPCRAGYFCNAGSTSDTSSVCASAGPCNGCIANQCTTYPASCYCVTGATTRQAVAFGQMSLPDGGDVNTRTGAQACPTGYTCANGLKVPAISWSSCAPDKLNVYRAVRTVSEEAVGALVGDPVQASSSGSLAYTILSVSPATGCTITSPFTVNSNGQLTESVSILYNICPVYYIQYQAQNTGTGDTIVCTVEVDIVNKNDPPTIGGCTARSVQEQTAVGSPVGSPLSVSDPDVGQMETFTILSSVSTPAGAPNPFTVSGCSGQLLVASTFAYNTATSYTLTVQVADNGSPALTSTCTVAISVLHVNHPPTIFGATFTISENMNTAAYVGALTVSDQDGDAMTYAVSRPDSPDAFTVDTGAIIRVKQGCYSTGCPTSCSGPCSLLDYEVKSTFVFDVKATDTFGASATATYTVVLTDSNDAPVLPNKAVSVPENSAVGTLMGTPVVATDEDVGQTLTYTVTEAYNLFQIVPASSGQLSVAVYDPVHLDYETRPTFTATITAKDNLGAQTSATLTVTVLDINEAPIIAATSRSLNENVPLNTAVAGAITATDPDNGQSLYFAITAGGGNAFMIVSTTGVLRTIGNIDYETQSVYTITVSVTDTGVPPLTSSAAVTVTVINQNDPPFINTTVPYSIPENSANGVRVGSVVVLDQDVADAAKHTVTIMGGNLGTAFAVKASSAYDITVATGSMLDFETYPYFDISVKAVDPAGASGTGTIRVSLTNVNELCNFVRSDPGNLGPIQRTIKEGATAGTVAGSPVIAIDPDAGDRLTYKITSQGSPAYFYMDPNTGQISVAPGMTLPGGGSVASITMNVACTDLGNLAHVDQVQILFSSVNNPPFEPDYTRSIAENAIPGPTAYVGLPVLGSDPDVGQTATLKYEINAATNGGINTFQIDLHTAQINLALPVDFETVNQYVLTIKVTDSPTPDQTGVTPAALWAFGHTTVNILDVNENPVFGQGSYTLRVNENSAVGTQVGTPVKATDPDIADGYGSKLVYSIGTGNTGGAFGVNASTGQLVVAKAILNFEAIPQYTLAYIATDLGGLTATVNVYVNLNDVNDPPVWGALPTITIPENVPVGSSIGAPLSVTDEDRPAQGLTFFVDSGGKGIFGMRQNTGQIYAIKSPDFEAPWGSVYNLVVRVTDSLSNVTAAVTVLVTNVNEPPVYGSLLTVRIPENSAVNTLLFQANATDPDFGDSMTWAITGGNTGDCWRIDAITGKVFVKTPSVLNYEPLSVNIPQFVLSVTATDNGGLTGTGVVSVYVLDVNEVPTIVESSESIREETTVVNDTIGSPVTVKDEDFGQSYVVSITDSLGHPTTLFGFRGYQLVVRTPVINGIPVLDYETKQSYSMLVTVIDNGVPPLSSTKPFTIQLIDINEPPVLVDQARTVPENSARNYPVGIQLNKPAGPAYDPDVFMNQQLTFKIIDSGGYDGLFIIDACSGQIKVSNAASLLNYELNAQTHIPPIYRLQVQVTDDGDVVPGPPHLSTTAFVNISVTDVNEPPVWPSVTIPAGTFAYVLQVPENSYRVPVSRNVAAVGMTAGAPVVAVDPDWYTYENVVTYVITGGNLGNSFMIGYSSAQLKVAGIIDYETLPSTGTDKAFILSIVATDNGIPVNLSATGQIYVNITDQNEIPRVSALVMKVPENSLGGTLVGTIVASDDDAGQTTTLALSIVGGNGTGLFVLSGWNVIVAPGAALDFESANTYVVSVAATDVGGLSYVANQTIKLVDVNEKPSITPMVRAVQENSAFSAPVGARLTSTDPDIYNVQFQKNVYQIVSGNIGSVFVIDSNTGQLLVAGSLDFETLDVYTLDVLVVDALDVSDQNGHCRLCANTTVTVNIIDVNEAPSLIASILYVIAENSPSGTMLSCPALLLGPLAHDPDLHGPWNTLTYSITAFPGDGSNNFAMDSATGAMKVSPTGSLDYEKNQSYSVYVRATDGGVPPLYDERRSVVQITNVNENPYFTTTVFWLPASAPAGTAINSLGAADEDFADRGGLAYTMLSGYDQYYDGTGTLVTGTFSSTPHSYFSLDGAFGYLGPAAGNVSQDASSADRRGKGPPNSPGRLVVQYNDPVAFHYPNYFLITVLIEDSTSLNATATIRINVADVNTPPTLYKEEGLVKEFSIHEVVPFLTPETFVMMGREYDALQTITYYITTSGTAFGVTTGPGGWASPVDGHTVNQGTVYVLSDSTSMEYVDYEKRESATFTAYVMDNGAAIAQRYGNMQSAPAQITVRILNVNEYPYFKDVYLSQLQNLAIKETTPVWPPIAGTTPVGSVLGSSLLNYADDPDTKPDPVTLLPTVLTYTLVPHGISSGLRLPFSIDPKTGLITTVAPLDFETTPLYEVILTVSDNGSPPLSAVLNTTITIVDVNEAPWVINDNAVFNAVENSVPGMFVGQLMCGDVDYTPPGAVRFTYAIESTSSARPYFDVNASGAIVIGTGATLDFEDIESFTFIIAVTDTGSPPKTVFAHVTVNVVDINDLTLDVVSPSIIRTVGGSLVILTGTNMGPTSGAYVPISVWYGPENDRKRFAMTTCSMVPGQSNKQMACQSPPGAGSMLWFTMTVGKWTWAPVGSALRTSGISISYAAPVISETGGTADMDTIGGGTISLIGANFGPPNVSYAQPSVLYGPDPSGVAYLAARQCAVRPGTSHTVITCLIVPGVGSNMSWILTVAGQQARFSVPETAWYSPPVVSAVLAPLLETAGGETIVITGEHFGPSMYGAVVAPVVVTYGPHGLQRYSPSCVIQSDTSITCVSCAGAGAGHVWFVTVGGQTSATVPFSTSYKPPVITRVYGPGHTGSDTAGGSSVSILGAEFSNGVAPNPEPIVTYGPASNAAKYLATCRVQNPHQLLSCATAPGVGKNLWWIVTVDGQSVTFDANSSYAHPVITSYNGTGSSDAFTRGHQPVYISGKNFGPESENAIDSAMYGGAHPEFVATSCAVIVSHTLILCATGEGAGASLTWSIVIAGLESVSPVTSYAAPVITGFSGPGANNANTDGGQLIYINGKFFGPQPWQHFLEKVTYGPNGVEVYDATSTCSVISHELIACTMLPGVGSVLKWFVQVRGQRNPLTSYFSSYAPPQIVSATFPVDISPGLDPQGGTMVTLVGHNFGLLDKRVTIQVMWDGVAIDKTQVLWTPNPPNVVGAVSASQVITVDEALDWLEAAASVGLISNSTVDNFVETSNSTSGSNSSVWAKVDVIVHKSYDTSTNGIDVTVTTVRVNSFGDSILLVTSTAPQVHQVTFLVPPGEGCCKLGYINVVGEASITPSPTFALDYAIPQLINMMASTVPCTWTWSDGVNTMDASSRCIRFDLMGKFFGRQNVVRISTWDTTGTYYNLTTEGQTPQSALEKKQAGGGDDGKKAVLDCTWKSYSEIYCEFIYFGFYGGGSPAGFISVADVDGRHSETKGFSNFSPELPAARIAILQGESYRTDGSSWMGPNDADALEGANIGNRTMVFVDGRKCGNVPPWNPADEYLHLLDLTPFSQQDDSLKGKAAGRVKCIVPRGYGGGSIKVFNDNMPNEIPVGQLYMSPTVSCIVQDGVSTTCPPNAGPLNIRPRTDGTTRVTIIGDNFGNMVEMQADCSNNVTTPLSECLTSNACMVDKSGLACIARPRDSSITGLFTSVVQHVMPPLGFITLDGEANVEALVRVWDHKRIVLDIPVGSGAGRSLVVGVGVNLIASKMLPAGGVLSFNYAPPAVRSVSIINAPAPYVNTNMGATEGGQQLQIVGDNFAVCNPNTFGNGTCVEETSVDICRCANNACTGSTNAILECKPCPLARDVRFSSIVCMTPAWAGAGLFVRVTARNQDNTATDKTSGHAVFQYRAPEVLTMSVNHASTGARSIIHLTGLNFGPSFVDFSVTVRGYDDGEFATAQDVALQFHDRVATVSAGRTHTAVSFMLPEGQGYENDVFVTVAGQDSQRTLQTRFHYEPPTVFKIVEFEQHPRENRMKCCNTEGGYTVTVLGDSFGLRQSQAVYFQLFSRVVPSAPPSDSGETLGYIGETPFVKSAVGWPVDWLACPVIGDNGWAHNQIQCTMPAGIGANLTVGVFVGRTPSLAKGLIRKPIVTDPYAPLNARGIRYADPQVNRLAYNFSYDAPVIDRMQPDPADADGGLIKFFGINFGKVFFTDPVLGDDRIAMFPPAIAIGSEVCVRPPDGSPMFNPTGEPYLICMANRHTVGLKNMTVTVAGQTTLLSADWAANQAKGFFFTFESYCTVDKYGEADEWCVECPMGGKCGRCLMPGICDPKVACYPRNETLPDGTLFPICANPLYNEPYADVGWWGSPLPTVIGGTSNPLCPAERADRTYCPFFVPCQPADACTGNNTCSKAYVGDRCASCAPHYYRLNGVCKPCPDNPWLLVMAFFLVACGAVVIGYLLNKKNMHLAFMSIGVDYLQVVAMFARANVPWPPILTMILEYLQFFNINLELMAPECTIPSFGYENKFFSIEGLPMGAAVLLAVMYVFSYLHKRFILQRKRRLHTQADALVGSAFSILYYLYLYITRTTLDIFNCTTTNPPDGHEYMSSIFVECYQPGGLQMTLLPWAVAALLVYSIGFVGWCFWVMYKQFQTVMEDQVLRCYGLGDNRNENPNAYGLRRRYHKLYYHYKPKYWFWRILVLLRKFCIAFTSLMFQKNVTFQMACLILVIIIAYAMQVKYNPYMSMSERPAILKEHEELVAAGHPVHSRIATAIEGVLKEHRQKLMVAKRNRWTTKKVTVDNAASFFFDYNTVEAVLLYCCILITLAAIMFTSVALEPLTQSTKDLEVNVLTAATLVVMFGSFIYFLAVLGSEMYVTFWPEHAAARQKVKAATKDKLTAVAEKQKDAGPTYAAGEGENGAVGINPMFVNLAARGGGDLSVEELMAKGETPTDAAWASIRKHYQQMQTDFANMKRRNQELEVRAAVLNTGAASAKKKAVFAPQRARDPLASQTTQLAPAEPRALDDPTLPEPWFAVLDPNTGRTYYVNGDTDETRWDRPV